MPPIWASVLGAARAGNLPARRPPMRQTGRPTGAKGVHNPNRVIAVTLIRTDAISGDTNRTARTRKSPKRETKTRKIKTKTRDRK